MSSFQLTNFTPWFFRGLGSTTNQNYHIIIYIIIINIHFSTVSTVYQQYAKHQAVMVFDSPILDSWTHQGRGSGMIRQDPRKPQLVLVCFLGATVSWGGAIQREDTIFWAKIAKLVRITSPILRFWMFMILITCCIHPVVRCCKLRPAIQCVDLEWFR